MPKNVFAGTGISRGEDPTDVGAKAVEMAIKNMKSQGGKMPGSLGFLFVSSRYDVGKIVDGAHEIFDGTPWIGCTTCGELSNYGFSQGGCVAGIISTEYIRFSLNVGEDIFKDPFNTGKKTAEIALEKLEIDRYVDPYVHYLSMKKAKPSDLIKMIPYGLISIISGSTRINPSPEAEVIEGIKSEIGVRVPIIGGSAADDGNFLQTYQFCNGKIYKNALIIVAFISDVKIGYGLAHGFRPTEKIAIVSEVKNNHVVTKLNNRPALEVLSEMIGKNVEELTKFIDTPAGIKSQIISLVGMKNPLATLAYENQYWLKVPIGATEDGGILFAPIMKEDTALRLMEGDEESTLNAAVTSIRESIDFARMRKPAFSLIFDCALRWLILRDKVGKEVELIKRELKNTPFLGFYTYGEHGFMKGGLEGLHNQTIASMTISDELFTEIE
jgi:hypothetical protein